LRNRFPNLASSELPEAPAPAAARRKTTLADVAEQAGVSTSTASRALNGHGGLAPATRAAVQDAAAKLNFQPSALARSLRTQQTFTVGFVVPDVSSPFYAAALKGAQGRLEPGSYTQIRAHQTQADLV
jgi:DNA-binding LacI/PurR family transcriptional regulator